MRSNNFVLGFLSTILICIIVFAFISGIYAMENDNTVEEATTDEIQKVLSDDEYVLDMNTNLSDNDKLNNSLNNIDCIIMKSYGYNDRYYTSYSVDIKNAIDSVSDSYNDKEEYSQPIVVKNTDSIRFICPHCTHELTIKNSSVAAAMSQFVCPDCNYRSAYIVIKCTIDENKSANRLLYYTLIGKMDHDIGFEY